MPQADDDQRSQMEEWFGDPIDDAGPLRFLDGKGWTFPGGLCKPPELATTVTVKELECVYFLCDEWDYAFGGVRNLGIVE